VTVCVLHTFAGDIHTKRFENATATQYCGLLPLSGRLLCFRPAHIGCAGAWTTADAATTRNGNQARASRP
jgi:hypothetical protein